VDRLERKWSPADTDEIRRRYREVYAQLFADPAALEAWLSNLAAQAGPLGLNVQVEFGASATATPDQQNLAVVPARILLEVQPAPGGNESSYQRLLRFTEQLAAEGKRADLAELHVVGGNLSIPSATLVFNLWAGEAGKP
jgi:hypothetical protein